MTGWLRLALLGALLAAFALRVVAFGELPPGLHADEAVDGLDAASGILAPFYPANNGREGMFVLFLGPALAVLGREPSALRLPMAFVGVLTVAATFALGRLLFRQQRGGDWIAAAGAGLVAVSLFPAVLNRFGARVSLLPLALALGAFLFWRAWQGGGLLAWAIAGAALGASQYTYTGARLAPLLLVGYAALAGGSRLLRGRRPTAGWWRGWVVFFLAAVVVVLPLALYALREPASFFQRPAQLLGGRGAPFLERLLATLPMFVLTGDPKPVHNLPGEPIFGMAVAPFAALGLLLAVRRLAQPPFGFLLWWVALGTLGAAITVEHKPHYVHALGLVPALFFLPALGLVATVWWLGRQGTPVLLAGLAAATLVGGVFVWSGWRYLTLWPQQERVALDYWTDVVAELRRFRQAPAGQLLLILLPPRYRPDDLSAIVRFLIPDPTAVALLPVEERALPERLAEVVAGRQQVVRMVLDPSLVLGARTDEQELVDSLLLLRGEVVALETGARVAVARFALDAPPRWPAEQPAALAWPGGRLLGWAGDRRAERVWVSIRWELAPTGVGVSVSLRLLDPAGHLLAQDDQVLVVPRRSLSVAEPPRQEKRTHHLFELAAPKAGALTVVALLYESATLQPLGEPAVLGLLPERGAGLQ